MSKKTADEAFSREHKRMLAGQGRTLQERLAAPEEMEGNDGDARAVLSAWREKFPTEESFHERLAQLGVTRAECREAIAADRITEDAQIPEWVEQVEEMVESVTAVETVPDDDTDGERAFAPVSKAIGEHARARLDPTVHETLSTEAVDSMVDWLRLRIEEQATRILFVEFKTWVATDDRELAFTEPEAVDEPYPTQKYEAFLAYLFAGGFRDLCQEYPVFSRLTATRVRQWVEHLTEFAVRLDADRERLTERFDVEAGEISELEPFADDTHGDGRAVMRVTFDDETRLAYKPRSVDAGATFYDVIDRLNDRLPVPSFDTPTYLPRDGYGWMEWVRYAECPNPAAVERYYQRAGALTCVAYFFEFTDCQFENLLVAGEHPVLVDAETVFTPHIGRERRPNETGIGALRDDTVLLTLMLPYDVGMAEDREKAPSTNIAGLSKTSDEAVIEAVTRAELRAVNTDVMAVDHVPTPIDRSENVPQIDGRDQPPGEFVEPFVEGFTDTYRTVLQLRDDGEIDDLLTEFAGIENRLVYRPTMNYGAVIKSLFARDAMADGARAGVEIEELAVPFCTTDSSDPPWPLYDAERRTLRRLDPPRFTASTDGTQLELNGEPLDVSVETTGLERSRRRIASADIDDMDRQVELIRASFGARPAETPDPPPRRPADADRDFGREAKRLFEEVLDAGLRTGDSYRWTSIAPYDETDQLTLRPGDESLYTGRSGVAVLAAALYAKTGDGRYRDLVTRTLAPVRESIRIGEPRADLQRHGGAVGVGAVAYTLSVVGDLLGDTSFHADAGEAATFVTEETLADDDTYDATSGAAGTVLGMLGAYARTDDDRLRHAAERCGDHLLDAQTSENRWQTIDADGPPLTGFAHGAAGLGYALYRLADVSGVKAYADAAEEAITYEAETYLPDSHNWPDLREWAQSSALDQWCHGRSGIGLARIGTARHTDDPTVTADIHRAIEGVPEDPVGHFDHVCCGNAGRIEFLLSAREYGDDLEQTARRTMDRVLTRARENGSYRTLDRAQAIRNPTFFHGLSGIGYEMLRLTDTDLPNVLLWE